MILLIVQEDKKKEGKNSKDIPKKTVHTEDSKEDDRKKKRKILNPADQDFLESEKICIQNEPAQKKEKKILKEKSNTLKIRSSSRTSGNKHSFIKLDVTKLYNILVVYSLKYVCLMHQIEKNMMTRREQLRNYVLLSNLVKELIHLPHYKGQQEAKVKVLRHLFNRQRCQMMMMKY